VDVLLAALSASLWGSADFMGGLASRRNLPLTVTWLSQIIGLLSIVAAAVVMAETRVVAADLWWGAAAGAAGALGLLLLYAALATGPMTVVAPTTAVCAAVVPVVAGLVEGERPSAAALVGMLLALPAIVLVAGGGAEAPEAVVGHQRAQPKVVGQALVSGLMFGLFFVFIDRAGSGAGMWPLVGARVASVSLLCIAVAAYGIRQRRAVEPARLGAARSDLPLVVGAGVLDVAANAFFVLATREGALSQVAVISSMYPAATVVLARVALRERFSRAQLAGLVLAAVAIGLVAYGRS
jgi:drug/metabolite transporter (DMT)-like permease